ncbi:MAG: YARHG domain-containing protein [Bacteroidetes bacterium]|nr:YARHG domain-containing protein [Bacteroidota bacterium]
MLKYILIPCLVITAMASCRSGDENGTKTTAKNGMECNTTNGTNTTTAATTNAATAMGENTSANENRNNGSGAGAMQNINQKSRKTVYRTGTERHLATTKGWFPQASDRLLNENDVKYLTNWGMAVMKNEIYARHGMIFKPGMLRDHFAKQSWYHPAATNVQARLTSVEKANLNYLENYKEQQPANQLALND